MDYLTPHVQYSPFNSSTPTLAKLSESISFIYHSDEILNLQLET